MEEVMISLYYLKLLRILDNGKLYETASRQLYFRFLQIFQHSRSQIH